MHYENGERTKHIRIGEEPSETSGRISPPIISNLSINPLILVPPEPAVREEEKDISLTSTNLEDDEDDFGGAIGTKWEDESPSPSPTSNSSPISCGGREVAMMEAMNGQFKLLVKRFLEVEGIPLISTEGDSWLDVVANISWEAAELIKPEPSEGKEMDPWSYIKVKCVASGTPTQRYCHFFPFCYFVLNICTPMNSVKIERKYQPRVDSSCGLDSKCYLVHVLTQQHVLVFLKIQGPFHGLVFYLVWLMFQRD